jgi:hypothetical protein
MLRDCSQTSRRQSKQRSVHLDPRMGTPSQGLGLFAKVAAREGPTGTPRAGKTPRRSNNAGLRSVRVEELLSQRADPRAGTLRCSPPSMSALHALKRLPGCGADGDNHGREQSRKHTHTHTQLVSGRAERRLHKPRCAALLEQWTGRYTYAPCVGCSMRKRPVRR